MPKSTFHYVTYIRTTPERLWSVLTEDRQFMEQYWFGVHCESEWKPGSSWKMLFADGRIIDAGEIVEADPPRRLVIRWRNEINPELNAEGDSLCTMELEPSGPAVRFSLTHSIDRDPSKLVSAVSTFWPQIIANLKSLLETGSVTLEQPFQAAA
jgi:uncharacterized protein YndB with AHSA1/START domain